MHINIFKHDGKQLFDSLLPCNEIIQQVYNKYEQIGNQRSTWWFDPPRYVEMNFNSRNTVYDKNNPTIYLHKKDLKNSKYFKLYLYCPNYITILLLHVLFKNRKDILIEDLCGGDGRLFLFLSKLKYNNFSMIDDFSQVNKHLFNGMMADNNLSFVLNNSNTQPIVISHMGYPLYPKNNLPDSVELICQYGNSDSRKMLFKLFNNKYVELCTDSNEISTAYCRKDKHEEFLEIIKPYEDIE